jgi:hypothetical protein
MYAFCDFFLPPISSGHRAGYRRARPDGPGSALSDTRTRPVDRPDAQNGWAGPSQPHGRPTLLGLSGPLPERIKMGPPPGQGKERTPEREL